MITMNRVRALAAALLGVVLVAPSARAQAGSGNAVITGMVQSEFGRPFEAGQRLHHRAVDFGSDRTRDGRYTITIPAARVSGQQVNLRVRAIGQQPSVKPIRITAGTQTVNFDLKQDINRLDEVVVTGVVGEGMERSKVPFAVGRICRRKICRFRRSIRSRRWRARSSGMRIASTSGRPGTTPEIQLRGVDVDQLVGPQHGAAVHRRRRDHERRLAAGARRSRHRVGRSREGRRGCVALRHARGERRHHDQDEARWLGRGRGQVQRPLRVRRERS